MNNSVKRVEPNPFGRIGLVAMSKKEHNSIGDWALQQKRRRQLNELLEEFRKRAPWVCLIHLLESTRISLGLSRVVSLNLMIGQKLETKLGVSNEQLTKRLLKPQQT